MKHIRLIWLFFSIFLLACVDDTSEFITEKSGGWEQVVLKLNVQKESVVRTRATNSPDITERVDSIDFLIFNATGGKVVHERSTPKWTGSGYEITVNIPSIPSEHILYLIANHQIDKKNIKTLSDLEGIIVSSKEALVKAPFVMATEKITLSVLNADAVSKAAGKFKLKRIAARFSINVTAPNFILKSVEWRNCPTSATVFKNEAESYESPKINSVNNVLSTDKESLPIYFYQIQKMRADAHEDFHVVIGGSYAAADGTITKGYYKLRLYTKEPDGTKKALTSIEGNNYYKVNILSVSGKGASSSENAEKNGFSNDMEAVTILDFTSTQNYRETYFQNGYQLGFTSSHWQIYTDTVLESYTLGYFYRAIRDSSLRKYTTLDPDYPKRERKNVIAKEGEEEITGMKECFDTENSPVEMELCFTDDPKMVGKEYEFTSVIQYGVIQKEITIKRYPSIDNTYTVLTMPMNYGEIEIISGNSSWVGLAAQRHNGATLYSKLSTDNNYIFIHIKKNETGISREAYIHLFGLEGYSRITIQQKP